MIMIIIITDGVIFPANCKMKSVEEDCYMHLRILEYDDLLPKTHEGTF